MIFFFQHHGMEKRELFQVYQTKNESFPAHLHRAYELIFVKSGTLSLQVDQKQYLMSEGELAFIFCNQMHSFSTTGESDIIIALFSPEMIGDFYLAYKDQVPANNIIRPDKSRSFDNLESIYTQKSLLYYLCGELLAATNMEAVSGKSQVEVLQRVFYYVDQHFGRNCSLKAVSKSMQYDYTYLSKLFSGLTGMHFSEYVNRYRIAQACYMLKTEKQTISEISSRCGYTTLRTFHRNFRLVMNCPPREYLSY